MISIDCLHISLNRLLLLTIGLWPYQQSILVRLHFFLFFGILTTFILFQFTVLFTFKYTLNLLIEILSSTLFFAVLAIKYLSFNFKIEIIKCLLEQLQHMYNELIDKNEIDIIKKHASFAKRYAIAFLLLFILIAFTLSLCYFWPLISNILFSTNVSQLRPLPIIYFIDQEKYFYVKLFHFSAAFIIGCTAIIATGAMLIIYVKYICGMFQIASYRITRVMTFENQENKNLQNENLICKKIIRAVDMQRKAMQFCNTFTSTFHVTFCIMIVVGITCESLNLFLICQIVSFEYDTVKLTLNVGFLLVPLLYMIICNYCAQEMTDYSNDIYDAVYSIQWYMAPIKIQKIILFLLQRSTKVFQVQVGGIFVASREGAATMLSTVVSYFTVLYSVK
ncbi:uncharacterized protein LOC105208226 [Solenopsis invicta]|uniref:uncharacterized protein LOC105208226 n=1 Tax=Solenopsis invicta TaxID=13686 RepID=UPI00193CD10C|nr:uncharacterized protein LOC105208226 [Solenopsis invicta]